MHSKLILITAYLLTLNCISSTQKLSQDSLFEPFGVVYSDIEAHAATGYKVLIVEPYFYTKEEVSDFQSKGLKVIAYLSLGEVNVSRKYFQEFRETGLKGKNENHGSYFIDISKAEIKEKFINEIVPELLSYGYDGLFLDTIDSVAPYTIRRGMQSDMVELISEIRSISKDKLLIQNSGVFLLDKTAGLVDAVAIEAVASGFDFEKDEYKIKSEQAFEERLFFINSIASEFRIPILIIDFAEDYDKYLQVKARLEKSVNPYFISNIEFKGLPKWNMKTSKLKKGA